MLTLLPLATENPLLPKPIEVILSIVFVLLLTLVIWKMVVPRFEATYAERTATIQGGIEKAEKAQEAAEAALQEYQAQLAEARTEAARIREDAKTQGAQILAEMRDQAQAESARIRASAQTQLEAERTQVMTQLRSEIG
ncbi:MAG TPA: F0F1 ATP synthase subunit B, partial [Propionibacteriaceae bacterium]|nr:F0F1 ATP synthase subunit B [Propionibacteriaceae bacterium]